MNYKDYSKIVKEILEDADPFEATDLADDYDLLESEILDSLTLVYLVTELEKKLEIVIAENLVVPENFRTVEKIVELLQTL